MTDRKLTCAACKSAITKGDIAGSDLEFGGELKATDQPTYTADADTDLVATVGTMDEYTPMVRTSGNQTIGGLKTFTNAIQRDSQQNYADSGYTQAIGSTMSALKDSNGTINVENLLTKESESTLRFDQRLRSSKDGTNGNRIDTYLRTIINDTNETVTLQLFILVYENGVQVRGKSTTIATLQAE